MLGTLFSISRGIKLSWDVFPRDFLQTLPERRPLFRLDL
jgi:hypothetical protein